MTAILHKYKAVLILLILAILIALSYLGFTLINGNDSEAPVKGVYVLSECLKYQWFKL